MHSVCHVAAQNKCLIRVEANFIPGNECVLGMGIIGC